MRKLVWASQVLLVVKNLPANTGDIRDLGSNLGSGRSPGGENGNPLQKSCLENPTDRGAWRAAVHGVTESQTQLKQLSTHACELAYRLGPWKWVHLGGGKCTNGQQQGSGWIGILWDKQRKKRISALVHWGPAWKCLPWLLTLTTRRSCRTQQLYHWCLLMVKFSGPPATSQLNGSSSLVVQSCPTEHVTVTDTWLNVGSWDPTDCSPPGSSVLAILQARILEQVTINQRKTQVESLVDFSQQWVTG